MGATVDQSILGGGGGGTGAAVGAAGGGGVDTGGGLVGAARVELDYNLSDTLSISAGLGRLQSLRGGGARPVTLHLGFKTRFSTFQ